MRILLKMFFLSWVVLSNSLAAFAEEPTVSFGIIGMGGGAFQAMKACENNLNVRMTNLTSERFEQGELPDLSGFDIIITSFASDELKEAYKESITFAQSRNPQQKVFCVGPPQIHAMWSEWVGGGIVRLDAQMAQYYGLSEKSMSDMVQYALITYCGRSGEVDPPGVGDVVRIFHPAYGNLESIDAFLSLTEQDGWDVEKTPRVALGTFRHHCIFHQPKVVEALINEFEEQGVLAVCLIADDLKFKDRLVEFNPDLVVMTSHTREPVKFWEQLNVPRIHALWFMDESIDEWRESTTTGMKKSSIQHLIMSAELRGATECLTSGGTQSGNRSGEEILPIPDRIRRIVGRSKSWINLRRLENKEKKVSIVVYDHQADKTSLLLGAHHGMNAPRSLVKLLQKMESAGYSMENLPADENELLERMIDHGRQMGSWEAGTLDTLAKSGHAILVPADEYRVWFESKVPHREREEVLKYWGEAPGELMVWESNGKKYLVLPKIDLGNVCLMTQPPKGEAISATMGKELDADLLPPTHHFLATYFWMQENFKPDALIHFGSHGNEWLFPGKQVALSRADWTDIMLADMPNLNPWLANNTAEVLPCKRRANAVTINFIPPLLMNADLTDELLNLESTIDKYNALDDGALKKKFAASITEQIRDCKLEAEVELTLEENAVATDPEIQKVSLYLHDLKNAMIPGEMHILGEKPDEKLLIPYLVHCMGKRYFEAVAPLFELPENIPEQQEFLRKTAEDILKLILKENLSPVDAVRAVGGNLQNDSLPKAMQESLEMAIELNQNLDQLNLEIDNILSGLNGNFIPPGPSGAPERNPAVVPTGKNMYVLNPEELPTRSSWELGSTLIKEYLETKKTETGSYPRKVAFTLAPFATYNDYGIIESQILYLMGVRPVWDLKNRVEDVELISVEELGRPRIDVFLKVASIYRDELPKQMKLIDKAVRLAATAQDGKENYVRDHAEETRGRLEALGFPEKKARALSMARMFGANPEEAVDGHNWFFYLTERSGEWETREDLLDVYLSHCKNVYTEGFWGIDAPETYDSAIRGTELILRSWYDNRDMVLGNKFAWWSEGSLSLAIKHITGKEPDYLFVDVRNPDRACIIDSATVVQRDIRARVLNPKWIKAMMDEGYSGGSQLAQNISNMMGWEIMRERTISDSNWNDLTDVYVRDTRNLNLRKWFDESNPHAFQKITATLLETIRKEYWSADEETLREIVTAYAESVARNGLGGGTREGGNTKLEQFVETALAGMETEAMDALLAQYQARLQEVSEAQRLQGKRMDIIKEEPSATPQESVSPVHIRSVILLAILLIIILGYIKSGNASS